jgi:H+/Cl- antiporter ClcA
MSSAPTIDNHNRPLGDFSTDRRLITLTAMAAVIGAISAFVAVALVWLIGAITNVAYFHRLSATMASPAANTLGLWAVLVPVVGGLVIGLMARFGSEKIRGHGIPEAMEAILIGQSRMSAKVAVLKPLSSAISIGTGGPFGAEGPIIMTGGAFGSLFAQAFHLSSAERKTLLVAGAAAGMSAIFAAPLAAVLIAVELLLFEWKPRSFVPVAVASVVAAGMRVPLLGAGPLFPVTPHVSIPATALGASLVVGVLAGLGSALLTAMVYGAEDAFAKLPIHWMWWPAIGGAIVGLGGLIEPRALGVGYDTIADLLAGHLVTTVVIALLATKAIIWSIALGSGTSGGVLGPLLLMGGALGAIEAHWIPVGDAALWTSVSMAAMMGGTMRSPLTAIVFLLELTHDVAALPALLLACTAAHAVTVLLMKRSILTEKVARRGYHVVREYAVSPLARLRVEDVMTPNPTTVPADAWADGALRSVLLHDPVYGRQHAWPLVDDDGALTGMLTRGDVLAALDREDVDNLRMREVGTTPPVVAYPDDTLEQALGRMIGADVGRLPVVDRDDPTRLVGLVSRDALAAAYHDVHDEEHAREAGPLAQGLKLVYRRLR